MPCNDFSVERYPETKTLANCWLALSVVQFVSLRDQEAGSVFGFFFLSIIIIMVLKMNSWQQSCWEEFRSETEAETWKCTPSYKQTLGARPSLGVQSTREGAWTSLLGKMRVSSTWSFFFPPSIPISPTLYHLSYPWPHSFWMTPKKIQREA